LAGSRSGTGWLSLLEAESRSASKSSRWASGGTATILGLVISISLIAWLATADHYRSSSEGACASQNERLGMVALHGYRRSREGSSRPMVWTNVAKLRVLHHEKRVELPYGEQKTRSRAPSCDTAPHVVWSSE
jgi:hypothetical protein